MRIKICGITNFEDAQLCSQLGADAIGFIFYKQSKRYITFENTKNIISQLPFWVTKVGVFVNEDFETINRAALNLKLNAVQLHGDEKPEFIEKIHHPVIKSFRINESFEFKILNNYNNCFFLLDTFSSKELGGTGLTFNWEIIPTQYRDKIILAGGINEDNVEMIYKNDYSQNIDLSSSLELSPGKKDKIKLIDFFKKIKYLEREYADSNGT